MQNKTSNNAYNTNKTSQNWNNYANFRNMKSKNKREHYANMYMECAAISKGCKMIFLDEKRRYLSYLRSKHSKNKKKMYFPVIPNFTTLYNYKSGVYGVYITRTF